MRRFTVIALVFVTFGLAVNAFRLSVIENAPKEPPEVSLLKGWINSFYENDAEKFWAVASKFEKPQYESLQDVRGMMAERMDERQLAVEIDRMPYLGTAKTISQQVDDIEYRVDNMGEDSAMYVFTAWVTRVIDFTYDEGRAEVTRKAALKVYVTMREGRLATYYSDETQMEKSFMNLDFDELERQREKSSAGAVVPASAHVN
ncbi:MAG: hypothetical protein ACNS63_06920 [Candidatus Nitrospinota bacterium M3_3B_026]